VTGPETRPDIALMVCSPVRSPSANYRGLACGVVPWHMVPSSSHQHQSMSVWPARAVKLLNQAPRFPSAGLGGAYTICSVAGI